MIRALSTLVTLAVGGFGLFFLAEKNPELKQKAEELLNFRTTQALETRFGLEQVQEAHERRLLKPKGARFLLPELKFYPHLLMEVKYVDKGKTKESFILWDLTDGEMILDTHTWEKTHGFADCTLANALNNEFQLLHLLSEKGGADTSTIAAKIELEPHLIETTIRSCLKKNLIISNGANRYRLHLENPRLTSTPQTKLYEQLTTRPHKRATRAAKHFSPAKITKMAKMAFGPTFSIRRSTEIYLPVHRLVVQNGDGSVQTYHFNALTGNELPPAPFYE